MNKSVFTRPLALVALVTGASSGIRLEAHR